MHMRYSELKIETLRQAPSRSRSEGAALLRRAGYLDRDGDMTLLGRRMAERLEELAESQPPAQLLSRLKIPFLLAENGEAFFRLDAGRVEIAHCAVCDYAASRDQNPSVLRK